MGQNRPKLAKIRYTRNAKFAKFGARGLNFSIFNFMGVYRKDIKI